MNSKFTIFPMNNRFLVEVVKNSEIVGAKSSHLQFGEPSTKESKYTAVKILGYSGEEPKFDFTVSKIAIVESFLLETVPYAGINLAFCPVSAIVCILSEDL